MTHKIKVDDVQVLAWEDHFWKRKIREAIEIKTEWPALNRDAGYELPDIYNDLLSHDRPHRWSCDRTATGSLIKVTVIVTKATSCSQKMLTKNIINHLVDKNGTECLNQSDEHELEHCLKKGGGYLESDCDEQLIITISFNQNVKVHSLKIHAPDNGKAPKTVKVFANVPNTLDFDAAERTEAIQTIELTKDDVADNAVVGLRFVKFQNVHSLTLFVKDNQGDEETTQIDFLGIIGNPVNTTKMDDFKRVAGKKGESH